MLLPVGEVQRERTGVHALHTGQVRGGEGGVDSASQVSTGIQF